MDLGRRHRTLQHVLIGHTAAVISCTVAPWRPLAWPRRAQMRRCGSGNSGAKPSPRPPSRVLARRSRRRQSRSLDHSVRSACGTVPGLIPVISRRAPVGPVVQRQYTGTAGPIEKRAGVYVPRLRRHEGALSALMRALPRELCKHRTVTPGNTPVLAPSPSRPALDVSEPAGSSAHQRRGR
jgi:hypothetical protein